LRRFSRNGARFEGSSRREAGWIPRSRRVGPGLKGKWKS